MAIESFAIAVGSNDSISGITEEQKEHHLASYPDDMIVFPQNTNKSVPALLDFIMQFGILSGYKINKSKTSVM